MVATINSLGSSRRPRADGVRNANVILDAASVVLSENFDASMEDIAIAAGLTRQTVYAHFKSRDALMSALVHNAGLQTVEAMDNARLDDMPAIEALRRYLDLGWKLADRYPFLLGPALSQATPGSEAPHQAGTARLQRLIRRGQKTGDFDGALPAPWLTQAVLGVSRAAFEQVVTGRMTSKRAAPLLMQTALKVLVGNPG